MEPTEAKVSVVVPVYGGGATVAELVIRTSAVLKRLNHPSEIILVNDASPDESWKVIRQIVSEHSRVVGINLQRNFGQHNALLAGIRAASGAVVVTIDDDLQHPPEEIPKLLAELESGYDVVYGFPEKLPHSFWRNFASWVTKITLQKVMGVSTARRVSAFRAFRTELRDAFSGYSSPYVSIDALLTWGTTKFSWVLVEHRQRTIGSSTYRFSTLLVSAMTMMTGFSVLPLRLASVMGFGFVLLGLAILVFVIGRYVIEGGGAPGFPFLASTIAIFSGAQLFALGIIGEYLARIHVRSMDRPPYLIRERLERIPGAVGPHEGSSAHGSSLPLGGSRSAGD